VPIWGKLGDLYGRKAIMIGGIGLFVLGSWLSGLSQSMVELIGFRGIQGIGGGALFTGAGIFAKLGVEAWARAMSMRREGNGGNGSGFNAGQSLELLQSLRGLPIEIARLAGAVERLELRLEPVVTREDLAERAKDIRHDLRAALATMEAEVLNHIDGIRP